jgi:hypothetical protein
VNNDDQRNYNPMDKDEEFEGLPHLWKSELYVNEITQRDAYWAIRGEDVWKKTYYLWI